MQTKTIVRILLLILLLLIVSGCMGIGGGSIGDAVFTSYKQIHPYRYEMLKTDILTSNYSNNRPFTMSDVEAEWGKPSSIKSDNNITSWIYTDGIRWKGVWGFVIWVPIPLAIPVGSKTVTFHFENDKLINWTIHDTYFCTSFTTFSLIPLGPEGKGFGLYSDTSCKAHNEDGTFECNLWFYDRCKKH